MLGRNIDGGIDRIPLPDVPGMLWLCGKHVVGPDPEAALRRVDATTIMCLNRPHELQDRYPGYVAWLGRNVPARAVWVPTPDLAILPLSEMRPVLDDLVVRLRRGERLIVHCAAGIGRSGTTAVAVLMLLGLDRRDALRTVSQNRPMAGPEVGTQRLFIDELAASLTG
jgi:Tyrosine phosphatase family